MREKGQDEEAIAAAFFVTPQVVRQRLNRASVAPVLLEVHAEDGMTPEQLMAFAVTPDHARQLQVRDAVKTSCNKEEYAGQDACAGEIDARLGEPEGAMEALGQRPPVFDPAEVARAGVFVTLDRDGRLAAHRGHVRPEEDGPRVEVAVEGDVGADAMGQTADAGVTGWQPVASPAGGTVIATLMVSIVDFQAGDGPHGAVPADEIDGEEVAIVSGYDPFG